MCLRRGGETTAEYWLEQTDFENYAPRATA